MPISCMHLPPQQKFLSLSLGLKSLRKHSSGCVWDLWEEKVQKRRKSQLRQKMRGSPFTSLCFGPQIKCGCQFPLPAFSTPPNLYSSPLYMPPISTHLPRPLHPASHFQNCIFHHDVLSRKHEPTENLPFYTSKIFVLGMSSEQKKSNWWTKVALGEHISSIWHHALPGRSRIPFTSL